MDLVKSLYKRFLFALPMHGIKSVISIPTLFPFHHIVSNDDVPHVKHLYAFKNVSQFKSDLDYLLKYFKPVSISDLISEINQHQRLPANSFLLTFDDGLREMYDVVAPILISKGVPAIFFVNPAFIDNKELFYRCKISLAIETLLKERQSKSVLEECARITGACMGASTEVLIRHLKAINNLNANLVNEIGEILNISFEVYLRDKKPFLTSDQIKKLDKQGFAIGAHSWDHPYYNLISEEEQCRQTATSCNYIHDHFAVSVNLFSFPYNDETIPQSFFNDINERHPFIDLFFGVQNQKIELHNRMIHRFNSEKPGLSMDRLLKHQIGEMLLQRISNKNKITRN